MNKIKYYIKFLIALLTLKSIYWSKIVMKYNLSTDQVSISEDHLMIKNYNLSINEENLYFILDSINYLDLFSSKLNAEFIIEKNNFYMKWDEFKLNITTKEEFFIVSEIFLQKTYNFIFDKPCIVIDIGFNVGIASLFFAKNNFVKKVYAFEPIDETFEQGEVNLSLNKKLASKIIVHNFGISNEDTERIIDYTYNNKGSIGKYGAYIQKDENTVRKTLKLKNFTNEYSKIIQENNDGYEILVKIDCEGDEYDIIKSLKSINNKLPKVILIEWHKKGPEKLIQDLKILGYSFFSLSAEMLHRGNLYCIRL